MRALATLGAVVAGLALSLPTSAQPVYKSTMPDGRVVYGPQPAPGAKKVDALTPPPASTGASAVTPQEKAEADKRAKQQSAAQAGGRSEVAAARDALKAAEAARDGGKEPLPGERIGTAGGASRLTEDYFARQKQLEQNVEAARRRLDEVQGR